MGRLGAVAVLSFLFSAVGTGVARRLLTRFGVLDLPNARSSHTQPTPRGGGIALVLTWLVVSISIQPFSDRAVASIVYGSTAIAIVGFLDDVRQLRVSVKLGAQILSTLALLLGGSLLLGRLDPRLPSLALWMAIPVTIVWMVGVCNAYNFMDGINGIAAIEAIVCGSTLALLAIRRGDGAAAAIAVSLAAASAGFLPWNFPKAFVFMGDVGSGTLGFLFAALAIRYAARGGSFVAAALPLFPFLFDTAATLLRRIANREAFLKAHRSHFYQRLTSLGWSHTTVSVLWGALAVCCGVVALFFEGWKLSASLIALAAIIALHVGLAIAITTAERHRSSSMTASGDRQNSDQPA